eukprot:2253457-Rhodomonas_salina.1
MQASWRRLMTSSRLRARPRPSSSQHHHWHYDRDRHQHYHDDHHDHDHTERDRHHLHRQLHVCARSDSQACASDQGDFTCSAHLKVTLLIFTSN